MKKISFRRGQRRVQSSKYYAGPVTEPNVILRWKKIHTRWHCSPWGQEFLSPLGQRVLPPLFPKNYCCDWKRQEMIDFSGYCLPDSYRKVGFIFWWFTNTVVDVRAYHHNFLLEKNTRTAVRKLWHLITKTIRTSGVFFFKKKGKDQKRNSSLSKHEYVSMNPAATFLRL